MAIDGSKTADPVQFSSRTSKCWLLTLVPVVLALLAFQLNWQYQYPGWSETVDITGSAISFTRAEDLIFVARGNNSNVDIYKSLGWMHAHDRYVQMCLLRVASQGRLLEHFPFSDMSFKIDMLSKQFDFEGISKKHSSQFPPPELKILTSYVEGVNKYMSEHPRPLEFALVNYHPPLFAASDILGMQRFVSYAGLDEICLAVEKILIEATTQSNVQLDFLKSVFSPHIDNLDQELIEIYKSIKDLKPTGEKTVGLRTITNSNNWVINGNLSQSGLPILSSDPHLDVSKIPNMFYESHYIGGDGVKVFGVSVPGLPIYLMGRNSHISYSLTYGMLDMADYFVENIKDGQYERDGEFYPFKKRTYSINGRDMVFYDTAEGHRLERQLANYDKPLVDGRYLALRVPSSIEKDIEAMAMCRLPFATDVYEAKDAATISQLGSNFLFADTKGNIAYQQCGTLPKRPTSHGLTPLPAWKSQNLWTGFLEKEDFHSVVNPPEGFIATANNKIQAPGKPIVSTYPALINRFNRITRFLKSQSSFSVQDMMDFQSDTYSLVAERIVPLLDPFLPKTGVGNELRNWDFRYEVDSKAAALFYIFFKTLTYNVGSKMFDKAMTEKYYNNIFGRYTMYKFALHAVDSKTEIFHGVSMSSILNDSISETLRDYEDKVYGHYEQFYMRNMFFDGKLPAFLGLDTTPTPVNSALEVVKVGASSTYLGKPVIFCQTWKFITDMASTTIHSILPGGPNGNFLSNIYKLNIGTYLSGGYHTTQLDLEF